MLRMHLTKPFSIGVIGECFTRGMLEEQGGVCSSFERQTHAKMCPQSQQSISDRVNEESDGRQQNVNAQPQSSPSGASAATPGTGAGGVATGSLPALMFG